MMSPTAPRLRAALLAGTSVGVLLLSSPALAQDMFVKRGSVDPGRAATQHAQSAATRNAAAADAARQALEAFRRSAEAKARMDALQISARAAAAAVQNTDVANGLGPNGLQPAAGVVFDPSAFGADDPRLSQINLWLGATAPTESVSGGQTTVTIEQTQPKAILTWDRFDVGRETTLRFDQSAGDTAAEPTGARDWVALNRVTDASADPTRILGQIRADGQVYVQNRNGVIFGGASQINVGSLMATTLAWDNAGFMAGLANANLGFRAPDVGICEGETCTPEEYYARAYDWASTPGNVRVDAGARITTAREGLVLMVGTNVENGGWISTPRGQTVLAAGEVARVRASEGVVFDSQGLPLDGLPGPRGVQVSVSALAPQRREPNERGGLAQLDNFYAAFRTRTDLAGMSVRNSGLVDAREGDITLTGAEVVQDGVLTADTTVALNGSVRLQAVHGFVEGGYPILSGVVRLGQGSLTEAEIDYADTAASPDASPFVKPFLLLDGFQLHLDQDSTSIARGGLAILSARGSYLDPMNLLRLNGLKGGSLGQEPIDGSRVYLERGSLVDVSGSKFVPISMERNSLAVELRGIELADAPLLRDTFLRGEKILIDVRTGTEIADVSGYAALVNRTAAERTVEGGEIQVYSLEDFIMRDGSVLDVSGGSLAYQDGFVRTTQLRTADGRLVDVGSASPLDLFASYGDYEQLHARWGVTERFGTPFSTVERSRFESGYLQGADAGALTLMASRWVVDGRWVGGVTVGPRQLFDAPSGARFRSGAPIGPEAVYNVGSILISRSPPKLSDDFRFDTALPADRLVSVAGEGGEFRQDRGLALLSEGLLEGFEHSTWDVTTYSEAKGGEFAGSTTVAADVDLTLRAGAEFDAEFIYGRVRAPGGSIETRTIGAGAVVDVSGDWFDLSRVTPQRAISLDGGSVTISDDVDGIERRGGSVLDGAVVDVSGGGYLDRDGVLAAGDGGTITYWAGADSVMRGTFRSLSLGDGGALALRAVGGIEIGGDRTALDGAHLAIGTDFFEARGFSRYDIATSGNLTVLPGAVLTPTRTRLQLGERPAEASGSQLVAFGTAAIDADPSRRRVHLALQAGGYPGLEEAGQGDVRVGAGARIETPVAGDLSLTADGRVDVEGALVTSGGDVALQGSVLTIAETGSVTARGAESVLEERLGVRTGSVLSGGDVTMEAETVFIRAGSVIDVSGASGTVDVLADGGGPAEIRERRTVFSDGGSISITADSGLIDGSLIGRAGGGAAAGGRLAIRQRSVSEADLLNGLGDLLDAPRFDYTTFELVTLRSLLGQDVNERFGLGYDQPVVFTQAFFDSFDYSMRLGERAGGNAQETQDDLLGAGYDPFLAAVLRQSFGLNAAAPPRRHGVSTAAFATGGFDRLTFGADHLVLDGSVELAAARSVDLNVARLTGTGSPDISIEAAFVRLDGTGRSVGGDTTGADGLLSVRADALIDVSKIQLGGLTTRFETPGDVRVSGILTSDRDLTFAAGQLYPVRPRSDLTVAEIRSDTRVVFERPTDATTPPPPLSVAGSLVVAAPEIEQGAVVRAPFGTIDFRATDTLALLPGSVTSVSGAGLTARFGYLRDGVWFDDPTEGTRVRATPDRSVQLRGDVVDVQPGATIDLSGGGDLHAYEWVPGPGGSRNYVASDSSSGGRAYAVMPGYSAGFAPVDMNAGGASGALAGDAQPGDAVFLSGVPGLPDGVYTLLPAHYALLPGAYRIEAVPGTTDFSAARNTRLADGSFLVSGTTAVAGSNVRGARSQAYRVMPGDVLRRYSEYREANANTFFVSDDYLDLLEREGVRAAGDPRPRTLDDAARLLAAATGSLRLGGAVEAAGANGGRRGSADISAERIAVVGAGASRAELESAGYLVLEAGDLSRLQFGSLLLGGERRETVAGTELKQVASEVLVENDATTPLTGSELLFSGRDRVLFAEGASVDVSGVAPEGRPLIVLPAVPADEFGNPATDDGAVVRLSAGSAVDIRRQPGSAQGLTGLVEVREGARLTSSGSLALETTYRTEIGAGALLTARDVDLTAERISLGRPDGTATSGVVLDETALDALAGAQRLALRSRSTIDVYGGLSFGRAAADGGVLDLTLDAGAIVGRDGGVQDVVFNARNLTLANSNGAVGETSTGEGTLTLRSETIEIGRGAGGAAGFAAVRLEAGQVAGSGAGSFSSSGDLHVESGLITAERGANTTLAASGRLTTAGGDARAAGDASAGARLTLAGAEIVHGGRVEVAGGAITLRAADELRIADGGQVSAVGSDVAFFDARRSTPGGSVNLTSTRGQVRVEAGALVDVSGSASGGDAGRLVVSAARDVVLEGRLLGHATSGGEGGSVSIDTSAIEDFTALNAELEAGGFLGERAFRVREGDVDVTGVTRSRNFALTADAGSVRVSGALNVGGADAGEIRIAARNGIHVAAGSHLDAAALEANGRSGRVFLATAEGDIAVDAGATIDLSGGRRGGGTLDLRAAQIGDGDVRVAALAGEIDARAVRIEAVRSYDDLSLVDRSVLDVALADAAAFGENTDAITLRLGWAGDPRLTISPGVEFRSAGDMTVAGELDLSSARYGTTAAPGVLTLRAAGNLNIDATVTDGFAGAGRDAAVLDGRSWGLRLVAGADLASSDATAVQTADQFPDRGTAGDGGDLVLGAGVLVRTGTGDIEIAAGGDVVLSDAYSSVYTAGRPTAPLDGYDGPKTVVDVVRTPIFDEFGNYLGDDIENIEDYLRADFNEDGGDLRIKAQGDYLAAGYTYLNWIWRDGVLSATDPGTFAPGRNTAWWTHIADFQGVGALGGGDVQIDIGGDGNNIAVAIPTHGRLPGTAADPSKLVVGGGGDLRLRAGGDINSAFFLLGRGDGVVAAGGAFGASRTRLYSPNLDFVFSDVPLHTVVALQDATLRLTSGGDLNLGFVFNPTFVPKANGNMGPIYAGQADTTGAFSTYTARSALELVSIGGDAVLHGQSYLASDPDFFLAEAPFFDNPNPLIDIEGLGGLAGLNFMPAKLDVSAVGGSVRLFGNHLVASDPAAEVSFLAREDIELGTPDVAKAGSHTPRFVMLDYDPETSLHPGAPQDAAFLRRGGQNDVVVHESGEPVRFYAVEGSIRDYSFGRQGDQFALFVPRATRIEAGRDVLGLKFAGVNNAAGDLTLIRAGRDIVLGRTSSTGDLFPTQVSVEGPGRLDLQAGRNLVVPRVGESGAAAGIVTLGDTVFRALPDDGASISVTVGVPRDLDLDAFVARYLSLDLLGSMPEWLLVADGGGREPVHFATLRRKMEQFAGRSLDNAEAWSLFQTSSFDDRWAVVREVLSNELRFGGREAVVPELSASLKEQDDRGYRRAYDALATLFPGAETADGAGSRGDRWYGNLIMADSQIRTQRGGGVDLVAPGGFVQIANRQAAPILPVEPFAPPQQGVITQNGDGPGSGAIRITAFGDVEINRSRVLTVKGGDITVWSSYGDIDAGRGAKTALSVPPKRVTVSADARLELEDVPDTSGSGIGALTPLIGTRRSDVDLYAPGGVIDAGDAGIRVSGNLFLGALRVLNADNVQVGGDSFGLPPAAVVNTGALTAASSAASAIDEAADELVSRAQANPRPRETPSIITGRFLGFGEQ